MLMPTMVHWHRAFATFLSSPRKHFSTIDLWIPLAGVASQPLLWLTFQNLIMTHSPTSSSSIQSQVFSVALRRSPIALLCPWVFEGESSGPWAHRISGLLFSWNPAGVSMKLSHLCAADFCSLLGSASMVGRITQDCGSLWSFAILHQS